MNFLVDAQLPRRTTVWLTAAGCDAIHTLDLPDGNRTTDEQINDVAEREQRTVVTKDADFVDTHILRGRPAKLLLISTGNMSNRNLEALLVPRIPDIIRELQTHSFCRRHSPMPCQRSRVHPPTRPRWLAYSCIRQTAGCKLARYDPVTVRQVNLA
jgi:predicted nuclease of predicted toxin-antitoxin system